MSETDKKQTPPYAAFSSFMNFINGLRDSAIPNRIDASVFGNASGSVTYSVLASLKHLNLIDEEGRPSERFKQFVNATDAERVSLLADILKDGYPAIFSDKIDLASATSQQFDELIRDEYGVSGSTVDKIASFFIAASKMADMDLSPHILKRRPLAASRSSRKSSRQRKSENDAEPANADKYKAPPPPPITEKQLEYRLVDLMADAAGDPEVMQAIIKVITFLKTEGVKATKETAADT